eukprot:CAMPEP_0184861892 /NCGR_PEP_ID=MMETSP0580-20130426/6473_1 /TAXON_ID=1118495 /ORGANISM="Dactyliosolen fragilissimus" /LENGTH=753 /DNA_ID=CAMNT_0027359551 /DNA_START=25 /DNA_END=2286 /DNA_ORIENTATION=-
MQTAMSTSSINVSVSENKDITSLSKSQKKRMKRNAAKARKLAENKNDNDSISMSNDNLNPHDKLRARLLALGFQLSDIDVAMEDMWNFQLPYDDLDEVLAFMQQKEKTASQEPKESTTTNNGNIISNETVPENPSQSYDSSENIASETYSSEAKTMNNFEQEEDTSLQDEGKVIQQENIEKDKDIHDDSTEVMDIFSKLDIVAKHENLSGSIAALNEWVVNAAKSSEIKDLCDISKTRALSTVIIRSISSTGGLDLIQQILDLITSLLQESGFSPSQISPLTKSLSTLLDKTRLVSMQYSDFSKNISSTVADGIVSITREALGDIYKSEESKDKKIQLIEEEVHKILSSRIPNGGGLVEIMAKRECNKVAAEKYSPILEIITLSDLSVQKVGCTKDKYLNQNEVLKSLLGSSYYDITSSKDQYEYLSKSLDKTKSSSLSQREVLNSKLMTYQAEHKSLCQKIENLQQVLDGLNIEEKKLKGKISDVTEECKVLDGLAPVETQEIEAEMNHLNNKVKLEKAFVDIIDNLNNYNDNIDNVAKRSSLSLNGGNANNQALNSNSQKIEFYLNKMKNYFESEAKMVEFIENRAHSLEIKLPELQREVDAFTSLNMTTNASEMTKSIEKTRKNILDDYAVCDALRGEAKEMKNLMQQRLHDYLVNTNQLGDKYISTSHYLVLRDIIDVLQKLGIDDRKWSGPILQKIQKGEIDRKQVSSINVKDIDNKSSSRVTNDQSLLAQEDNGWFKVQAGRKVPSN